MKEGQAIQSWEKVGLIERAATVVSENNAIYERLHSWYQKNGVTYLDGTKQYFNAIKNFDIEGQPHAGLREIIRIAIRGRLGI